MLDQIIIKPHYGIEGLPLGITRDDVLAILGPPDKSGTCDIPDYNIQDDDEIWLYYDLGLELTFCSDDNFKLSCIETASENTTLYNCHLIGLKEEDFLRKAKEICPYPIVLEDDLPDIDTKDYGCRELGLIFWFYEGVLDTIIMFPECDETGDNFIWPKR